MFNLAIVLPLVSTVILSMGQIWSAIFGGGEVREAPAVTAINHQHQMEQERRMQELEEQRQQQDQAMQELERQRQEQESRMHEKEQEAAKALSDAQERARIEYEQSLREQQQENTRQAEAALKDAEQRAKQEHDERMRQVELENERQREKTARDLKAAEERAKKAEADLLAGIRPDKYPTAEELQAIKLRYQYNPRNVHYAIVGSSGTGKSSLINALRGLEGGSEHTAETGTSETTKDVKRYEDPRAGRKGRLWWYDVPGGGTLTIPGADYFNSLGLYIFDAILVVSAGRFTELDVAILRHAKKWDIPAHVVRSKGDQDVQNRVRKRIGTQAYRKPASRQPAMEEERVALIKEVHANVRENLALEKMDAVQCFVVSELAMLRCVQNAEDGDWASIGEPEEDGELVTDPLDLDFEEKGLLEKLVSTTAQKRVVTVEKTSNWLESIVKRGLQAARH
ncbi:hypothetical protein CYLTODRAFT_495120 [Cylindrobasidium torrendii FP15055 ss-10]|uniref:IRG-type G domain-containing protein n=1 Tax=Cylindrobasidium torrendii FP15055 ss-10 TaxID=1314674 RepID=A0A0D7AUN4_9AGAR|nr:hypothetical protein CYLTODRAFT_495120 [Cylindrobasidium torrendii FP15055 ss-10]